MKPTTKNCILISVFVFSIVLRLAFLSVPSDMWHDPAFTYSFSKESISYILDSNDVHPPFYYLFFKAILFISSNEMFLRGINIVFWALFFYGAYLLLSRHFSFRTTYLTLLFMSLSPTLIYYSVEPRNYMMGLFFVVMQLYFFFDEVYEEKYDRNISAGFIIFSLLMLYTHYFTAFVLLIEFGFLLFKRDSFKRWFWNYLIAGVLTIPLMAYCLLTLPKIVAFWFKPTSLLGLISSFTYQFVFADSINVLFIIVAFMVIFLLAYSFKPTKMTFFLYAFFFIPVLTLFLMSFSKSHPMYHHRYFLFYAIALYILVALALDNFSRKYPKLSLVLAVLIGICLINSMCYTMEHQTQDLYNAQKFMKTQISPFDDIAIIHTASFSQTPFKYYFRDYNAKQLLLTNMNRKELFTAGGSVIKDDEIINVLPQHFYYLSDSANPISNNFNATKIYDKEGLSIWKR